MLGVAFDRGTVRNEDGGECSFEVGATKASRLLVTGSESSFSWISVFTEDGVPSSPHLLVLAQTPACCVTLSRAFDLCASASPSVDGRGRVPTQHPGNSLSQLCSAGHLCDMRVPRLKLHLYLLTSFQSRCVLIPSSIYGGPLTSLRCVLPRKKPSHLALSRVSWAVINDSAKLSALRPHGQSGKLPH